MDRNTIIGLVLIVGIVLTWGIISSPGEDDQPKKPRTAQTDSLNNQSLEPKPAPQTDTAAQMALRPPEMSDAAYDSLSQSEKDSISESISRVNKYGRFSQHGNGEDKVIHVVTDKLELDLHSKGGIIRPLIMREFQTYDSVPLPLVTDAGFNSMGIKLDHKIGDKPIFLTSDSLFLTPSISDAEVKLTGDQNKEIRFRGAVDGDHYFDMVYTFYGNSYDFGFRVEMNGMQQVLPNQPVELKWTAEIPKTEKSISLMRDKTAIYYRSSEDVDNLTERSTEKETEQLTDAKTDWVAFKSQFFSQTLMVDEGKSSLENVYLTQTTPAPPNFDDPESGEVVRKMEMVAKFPIQGDGSLSSTSFTMVNAPLEFDLLRDYERDMTRQIALGWGPLKYINMYLVIPVFNFLEGSIGSYGIIILILAFLIKLLLYPLTFKTYISSAKMRVINKTPEIKKLEEKFKDDPTKLQQEKMKIYRLMGVNMFGGCLPMLLQYPFLIALFFLFPNLIELRQQGFLWADDLSTYDSVLELGFNIPFYGDHVSLFTLLMTVSIFIYTIINQQMQGTTPTNPVMKYFPYVMPLIFLGFLNNYSAGLSWYYLISNLISITQAQVSKAFINEEKLLAQMRNTAKDRKASGKGQGRLAKWAENQQKKQQQMQKSRGGGRQGGRGGRR